MAADGKLRRQPDDPGTAGLSRRAAGRSRYGLAISIVATALAIIFVLAVVASAHDAPAGWSYPFSCCSGYDCRPVDARSVYEGQDGYTVPSGELLSYSDKRLKDSPDGEFHWCSVGGKADGKTICLFVPPRGF